MGECLVKFEDYAQFSHIKEMKDSIMPVVENFKQEMGLWRREHSDMYKCVYDFDRSMAQKANKAALTVLWGDTEKTYLTLSQWDKRNKELTENEQRRDENMARELLAMKAQRDAIEETIRTCVDDTTAKKLLNYDKVAKQFARFFDQEELQMVLDRKADLELINRLQDSKATKSEVKYQNALLEALNTRIKHLSILLAEIASS